MKMKRKINRLLLPVLLVLSVLAVSVPQVRADTITLTDQTAKDPKLWEKALRIITWAFVDNDDDQAIDRSATYAVTAVTGIVLGFHYIPSATAAPASGADFYVYNALSGGVDVLGGGGANLGGTETISDFTTFTMRPIRNQTLYFSAASLGTTDKAGTFVLIIQLP
jgi:hypothetical protein